MSIARSSLALFGTRSIGAVIGFGAIVVFARELGIAALGSYFLFQALLEVITLGADAGLKSAVEKRISEGEPAGDILGAGIAMKAVFLAVGATVVLALREPIAGYVGADLVVLLVCVAVLREFGRLTTFVLRGELRVPDSAMVELIQKGVYVVIGITLAFRGFGVRAPVYGLLAGYAVMLVVGAVRMDTRPGVPSTEMARSLLSYSQYKFVSQVGAIGYSWIDVLVIGMFLSPAAVGAYEVA
jgi:O-antigen/teichoic acid export membrane protein